MMLPLSLAEKLKELLDGAFLPASQLKGDLVQEMIADGVVATLLRGRTRRSLYVPDKAAFAAWLFNRQAITDLAAYIEVIRRSEATRAEILQVSNDSKAAIRRSFKGFLVNSYLPVGCLLSGQPFLVHPQDGSFQFVYDFEHFMPPEHIVIVGVENAENFRNIRRQSYLFGGMAPLFISRFPQVQSRDTVNWLRAIPNRYLHFGDFDFAGINIYLNEYKKHLGARASFFVPEHIEALLDQYGNRELYDRQRATPADTGEPAINELVALIHKYGKGLEQEALLIGR